MKLGKLFPWLVLVIAGCQHCEVKVNVPVDNGRIVEIVADKNMAMAMSECFADLDSPTEYPNFRKVSQMVRDFNFSSDPFSEKTSKLLEKFPEMYGNNDAYLEGLEEYTALIWGPKEEIILAKQKELQCATAKFLTGEYLGKIYHFYGAKFPKNFHSKVYLMPMLDKNGSATVLGEDKIFLNVMPCDIPTHLGVIAH